MTADTAKLGVILALCYTVALPGPWSISNALRQESARQHRRIGWAKASRCRSSVYGQFLKVLRLHSKLYTSGWVRVQIHTHKKKTGVIAPRRFVQRLKRDNELFRSYMHQVSVQA